MHRHILSAFILVLGIGQQAEAQVPCTGLCLQQTTCPGGGTTSVTGKVFAPNGTDPLPNVFVYVPNGGAAPTYGVQPFLPVVQAMAPVSGSPLVQTKTAFDGSFTLTNMPVGANIPLVIQAGKWRRQSTIPNILACVNTALPATQTRMPRTQSEGDIPKIAIVTGAVDAVECSMRKIGISDTEFSNPLTLGGTGRVNLYFGTAPPPAAAGAKINTSTPPETNLFSSLPQYDVGLLACQGAEDNPTAEYEADLVNFANSGGRVYAVHSNYPWLSLYPPFSATANWNPNQPKPPSPQTAYIDMSPPLGLQLAQWMQVVTGSPLLGQMQVNAPREDLSALIAPTQSWLTIDSPLSTMQFRFNTPVGLPPAQQYGFVLYHDYHIADTGGTATTGLIFPSECTSGPMTAQEKLLEFDLFVMGWTAPPTVTSISPNAGPIAGGTRVTITGINLVAGTQVRFGANAATSFVTDIGSDTSTIIAVAPAGRFGMTADVVVTTPAGSSAFSTADQFTYVAAPTVTSISPKAGPTAGGTTVNITGTGFGGATAVAFGATAATSFTVNSATSITAVAPASSSSVSGTVVDVVVTAPGGASATSAADQFAYVGAPTVTNISPTFGPTVGGTSVTITGTDLTGATAVAFGASSAASFTVNSSTSITATTPAGTGTVDVVVTTARGTSATSPADQFTFNLTASSVMLATNCQVTFVAGQNFSAAATVAGSSPTGKVNFLAGGNNVSGCTGVVLSTGVANCGTNNLLIGQGAMTATYSGDANNSSSGSSGLELTILDPADVIWRNSFEQVTAGCPAE